MVKQYKLSNGKLVESQGKSSSIFVYIKPDKNELNDLIEKDKIDEHTLYSALDPDEIGRLEFEPSHVAIIVKRPKNYSNTDDLLFRITSVGIFLFKKKMILVMTEDTPLIEGRQTLKFHSLQDVLLKFLSGTVAHFLGHLKVINIMSESIEQKINASMENKYLLNMFTLEKSLVYYLNSISSNSVLLEKLKTNLPKIGFSRENFDFLEDIIIENNQCRTQTEIYSNILTGLMDARGSIVNNNLNLLIKRLTIISIVFMPLNVIAGIGGMSEFSMMTSGIPWWISYTLFSAGLVVIALITYVLIRGMGYEKKAQKKKLKRRKPDQMI
jgi:magnesium transporter